MALRLAASLLGRQTFDAADVLSRYVRWWQSDGADSGPVSAAVLQRISRGTEPQAAVDSVDREAKGMTAGCNPAHRSVPLALAAFLAEDHLAAVATAEATLTHKHPLAGDVSACLVLLCRGLLLGRSFDEALSVATAGRSDAVVLTLDQAPIRPGGRGGYAPEVLQTAIHFVIGATDFRSALESSLQYSGPANYSPVLVGAIGGARWGATGVDSTLVENGGVREVVSELFTVADALEAGWL
jgi:ADP-ribosylglycohydrolase